VYRITHGEAPYDCHLLPVLPHMCMYMYMSGGGGQRCWGFEEEGEGDGEEEGEGEGEGEGGREGGKERDYWNNVHNGRPVAGNPIGGIY